MQNTQLRLFNAFKRSGFNDDDAMDVSSIVEKVSDVSDIRKDVSDIKSDISGIKTELLYIRVIGLVILGLLIKIVFFSNT